MHTHAIRRWVLDILRLTMLGSLPWDPEWTSRGCCSSVLYKSISPIEVQCLVWVPNLTWDRRQRRSSLSTNDTKLSASSYTSCGDTAPLIPRSIFANGIIHVSSTSARWKKISTNLRIYENVTYQIFNLFGLSWVWKCHTSSLLLLFYNSAINRI